MQFFWASLSSSLKLKSWYFGSFQLVQKLKLTDGAEGWCCACKCCHCETTAGQFLELANKMEWFSRSLNLLIVTGEMELHKAENPVKYYLINLLVSNQVLSNGKLKISLEGNALIQIKRCPLTQSRKAFTFRHEFPIMILGPAVDAFQNECFIHIVIGQLPEVDSLCESSEFKMPSGTAVTFHRLKKLRNAH